MADDVFSLINTLSEPLRVRLLSVLEQAELGVGELSRVLQLPQSTTSRHLKVLRVGGWITGRSVGAAKFFRPTVETLPPPAAELWAVVRAGVEGSAHDVEDRARLESVLAARRMDSRTFFGRHAGDWDEVRRELFGERFTLPAILELIPSGWTVLDLGCGTGATTELLAPAVRRVIAVDREQAMLDAAARRLGDTPGVELRQGELTDLPVADGEADAAICILVLHHVEDAARALCEAARILRPGGQLLLVDMVAHDRQDYRRTMGHAHLGFDQPTLARLCDGTTLTLARYRALPPDPDASGPGLFVARFQRK